MDLKILVVFLIWCFLIFIFLFQRYSKVKNLLSISSKDKPKLYLVNFFFVIIMDFVHCWAAVRGDLNLQNM